MAAGCKTRTSGRQSARVLQGHAARGAAASAPGSRRPDRALRRQPPHALRPLRGTLRDDSRRAAPEAPGGDAVRSAARRLRGAARATARCSDLGTCRCSSPGSSPRVSRRNSSTSTITLPWAGAPTASWRRPPRAAGGGCSRPCSRSCRRSSSRWSMRSTRSARAPRAHSDLDILRLYEIWLKTGSARCYAQLKRLGVDPTPGGTAFTH